MLNHTDFEHIDPGQSYYNIDYEAIYATQRPLFSYKPNTFATPSPDMASEPAQISEGGKTITVHIRKGVHFSPPVNREVTSADVAYAIERGANANVANPYWEAYFGSLVGAKKRSNRAPEARSRGSPRRIGKRSSSTCQNRRPRSCSPRWCCR